MTATVLLEINRLTESRSLSCAFGNPVTLGSNSGSNAFLPDADMVASVRPWKPPTKVMISCAPPLYSVPNLRASLIAPSLASAPEFAKNTWSKQLLATSALASLRLGPLKNAGLGVSSSFACAASASATMAGEWPRQLTAQPCMKSR